MSIIDVAIGIITIIAANLILHNMKSKLLAFVVVILLIISTGYSSFMSFESGYQTGLHKSAIAQKSIIK